MTTVYMENIDALGKETVVCLGFFDGVHLGHQQLIRRAHSIAVEKALLVCVHTFAEMPSRVIHPKADITELTPLHEKIAIFASLGVDITAVSHFDAAMMRMSGEAFFHRILLEKLHARHIVVGFHHRFGYQGEADTVKLGEFCREAGIGLDVIYPVLLEDGELISSSAIRSFLRSGNVAMAEAMLGRMIAKPSLERGLELNSSGGRG